MTLTGRRAVVLGTGLIGSSIGVGLRLSGWDVVGWDPDPAHLQTALAIGAVVRAADSVAAAGDADLVVLAGPVNAIVDQVAQLTTSALVTDVAGVKQPVVGSARGLDHFVGGHPMAGRETSGPQGATGSLFRGATWVLTTDGASESDLATMTEIVESLGANPVRMTAKDHDRAVSLASHLPHLAAAALVNMVASDDEALDLAAGGFRDLTRIAMSDPAWWVEVLSANRAAVVDALRGLSSNMAALADGIEAGDVGQLSQVLTKARNDRRAMAAPVETVGVILDDQPGEIARVGHSLSESGVDLRDLQLRHAVHGGGGVLTLSVRKGEADRLRLSLGADGFRLLG